MGKAVRLVLVAAALVVAASGLALSSAAGTRSDSERFDSMRFEATFNEANVSITNRVADLGIFQLINTLSGTVKGHGPATGVLAMSQDRSVEPCGPGSWTNAGIRRIVLAEGVLILREVAYLCQTAAGPIGSGTWTVDGASSTGVFADARGHGSITVSLATRTSTLEGRLFLGQRHCLHGFCLGEEG
ncbi:MAG: hypothetical protein WKF65_02875 [Gaiellaceae bacterium]